MKTVFSLLFVFAAVAVGGLGYVGFASPANSTPSRDTDAEETPSPVHTAKPVRVTATGSQIESLTITMNGLLINSRDGSTGFSSRDSDTAFQFGSRLHYIYNDQTNTLIARADNADNVTIRVTQGDNLLCERSVSRAFETTCTFNHRPLYELESITTPRPSFSGSLTQTEFVSQLAPDIGRNASFLLFSQLGLHTGLSTSESTAVPTISAANRTIVVRNIENNSQITPPVEGVTLPPGTTAEIFFRVTEDSPQRLAPLDDSDELFGVAVLRHNNKMYYLGSLDKNSVIGAL